MLDQAQGALGLLLLSVPERLVDLAGKGLAGLIMAGDDNVEVCRFEVADGSLTLSGRYLR